MAVYKFKISFEDYEDIYRIIEIKSSQTFLDFHKSILDSIGFDQSQLASFYMSNDTWKKFQEITLEDMTDNPENPIPVMSKAKLSQYIIDPHQKIVYIYDFIELWTLLIELVSIGKDDTSKQQYPYCSKTFGLAPKQYDKVQRFGMVDDDEFEEITKNYINKADEIPGGISDDEADEFGIIGGDQDEAEGGEEIATDDEHII